MGRMIGKKTSTSMGVKHAQKMGSNAHHKFYLWVVAYPKMSGTLRYIVTVSIL